MDLCWIIFLLSDLITEQALNRRNRGGPQQEERTGQPHGRCHCQDPPLPPRPLLVLLQMCLLLLETPHLRLQQP